MTDPTQPVSSHGHQTSGQDLAGITLLLAVAYDFAKDGDGLLSFLDHVGFDLTTVTSAAEIKQALPAFYRVTKGIYDVARLEQDLMTWQPIAAAVDAARMAKQTRAKQGLT